MLKNAKAGKYSLFAGVMGILALVGAAGVGAPALADTGDEDSSLTIREGIPWSISVTPNQKTFYIPAGTTTDIDFEVTAGPGATSIFGFDFTANIPFENDTKNDVTASVTSLSVNGIEAEYWGVDDQEVASGASGSFEILTYLSFAEASPELSDTYEVSVAYTVGDTEHTWSKSFTQSEATDSQYPLGFGGSGHLYSSAAEFNQKYVEGSEESTDDGGLFIELMGTLEDPIPEPLTYTYTSEGLGGDLEAGECLTRIDEARIYEKIPARSWPSPGGYNIQTKASTDVEVCAYGEATPVVPKITESDCEDEDARSPSLAFASTEGIEYTVDGDISAGERVTVTAKAVDGYLLTDAGGWTMSEDQKTATMFVEFSSPECSVDPEQPSEEPTGEPSEYPTDPVVDDPANPVIEGPTGKPIEPVTEEQSGETTEGELTYTGADVASLIGLAVASAGAGGAALVHRRRKMVAE